MGLCLLPPPSLLEAQLVAIQPFFQHTLEDSTYRFHSRCLFGGPMTWHSEALAAADHALGAVRLRFRSFPSVHDLLSHYDVRSCLSCLLPRLFQHVCPCSPLAAKTLTSLTAPISPVLNWVFPGPFCYYRYAPKCSLNPIEVIDFCP